MITETDGGDYDICNLADFSSDEEDNKVLDSTVCSGINVNVVTGVSPGLSGKCDASSSMITETDGGGYDVCNLADFSSDNEDTSTEGESGCLDIHFGEITQLSYEFSDLEDSDWEYEPDAICRRAVEHHNFDLIDGMTPRVFVPTPREDRRCWPKIDLIYRPKLWVLTNAPVIHTDIATVPNSAASAPIRVDVTVPLHKESVGNVDSPLRKRTDSCSADAANWGPKDEGDMGVLPVSATEANSELDTIVHPGTVGEVCCQTDEAMVPENQEDPSCVCLLQSNISLSTHRQTEFNAIQHSNLDRRCGICLDSGEIAQMDGYICFDCRLLMTLCCYVSCSVTVATTCLIKMNQSVGDRNPLAWGMDLLCNHMTPFDANRLCVRMNRNFKGGFDNVRTRNNDTVDSRGLAQCVDGQQRYTPLQATHRSGRRGGSVQTTPRFPLLIGQLGERLITSRQGMP